MKKNTIILFLIVSAFSCKKGVLDLQPFNRIETVNAFNTETDINLALNGMYAGLRGSATYPYYVNGTLNILADAMADNLKLSSQGRQTLTNFSEWRYNGDNTASLLESSYSIARRANAILENIEKFPNGSFKDNAKGEALAVRALVHFNIAKMHSKTLENATTADSSAPYITSTSSTDLPKKESVKSFYDKIINDLKQALPLINATNPASKFNRSAVNALLSNVYLYAGDLPNCITASTAALGSSPVLPSIADFPKIWTDETKNGVLFFVANTTLDNSNGQGVNYFQITGGLIRSEYVVEYNFRQLFTAKDVRTSSYIQTSPFGGVLQNHIVKYRARISGGVSGVAGVVDAKVLRTAEVLLNRAEAYQRSGNDVAALADLNLLKANRYTDFSPIVGLSGTALLNEIHNERRLEMAFEGNRFWDLKRRNLPVVRDGTKGDRADGTGTPFLFTTLPVGDHRFQLPFPSSEINFNKNFKQNPGY